MVNIDYTKADWTTYAFQVNLAIDLRVRGLCAKPYPGHKQGCPKYNVGYPGCPPDAPKIFDIYDRDSDFFMVVNEFNIKEHMQRLTLTHPNWSERQLRCCLYWQPTARKQLHKKIDYVLTLKEFTGFISTICPEALGVNVTETLKRIGITLEWPPVNFARQIALLGRPISEE